MCIEAESESRGNKFIETCSPEKKKKKVGLFLRKLSVFLDCKFNSLVCQLGIVFKDSFVIKLE